MSTTEIQTGRVVQAPEAGTVDYKLEVMVLPVSDVDRAKAFYASMGWREDADFPIREGFRIIQMTPPGSQMSVIFGAGLTAAQPGSYEGLVLSVYDIEAARADLVAKGIDVSEVWHGRGAFDRFGDGERPAGRDPEGSSYNSWASFQDPDGNTWYLQEIQTRLPGR